MEKNITDFTQVSHGYGHTVGLKQDGSLWAWGSNFSGQLGLGDISTTKHTPTQVGSDKDWVMITCGNDHTLGLKQDGSLWSWGFNSNGQLGLGDTTNKHTPTQVGSDKDWVMITSDGFHTVGLKQDGSLWAWGDNFSGQLGLGDTTDKHTPTQVGSDKDWVSIGCGYQHTTGLKQDGSLWAWGSNFSGQLGLVDVNTSYTTTPVESKFRIKWLSVVTNVLEDGTIMKWGRHAISHARAVYDSTDMYSTTPALVK